MRITIKGGVWKNTEDEILKAAVMKYGKNQWARISSLLVRKTPKQCKARWYEWLDPSIRKLEWSTEEDEKLLHLAKLMPTQWRTIAPIVGRTPAQCLERYQKLLDDAEAQLGGGAAGAKGGSSAALALQGPGAEAEPGVADIPQYRRLRAGEVDPDPETKPARPDPVDMDEDELEMLSEARARLANTQGKKAKRKARERQLAEARKLAGLQRRRELVAAGILAPGEQLAQTLARKKARKRGNVLVDYNRDIPFAKAPLPGFYDTNEELIKDSKSSTSRSRGSASGSVSLSEVEEKKKWELEQELEEQQDAEKGKGKAKGKGKGKEKAKERDEQERQERAMAYLQAKLNKQAVEKEQLDRLYNRPRLDLPAPQVSDTEMETIVKLAQQGESAQQLVGSGSNQKNEEEENSDIGGSSNVAGNLLLGSYSKKAKVDQILSSAQKVDKNTVMVEAMNLVGLTAQQTPLLGEENTPLHTQLGTGYTGITPRSSVTQTPSYLSTSTVSTTDAVSGQRRESSQQTPSVRDEFGLNTPRQSATSYLQTKKNPSLMISRALMNLPKPKNQFEIIVPHSEDEQSGDSQTMQVDGNDYGNSEQDMEIVHKQQLAKQRKLQQQIQNRRSTPIKRGLPRPSIFQSLIPDTNTGSHSSKVNSSSGAGSVDDVARDLLQKFSSIQQLQQQQQQQSNAKVRTTADGNDVALRMIDAEMALLVANDCTVSSEPSFSTNSQFGNLDVFEDKELQAARGLITEQLATEYPNTSDFSNSHTHSTIGSTADIEENKKLLASRQKTMIEMAQQANKLEKKLHVVLGGYERLSQQKAFSSFSNTNTNTNSANNNNNNNNNGGGKLYELFNLYENTVMQLRSFHALHTNELNVGIPVRVADLTERVQQLAHTERTLQQRYADLLSTRNGLLE